MLAGLGRIERVRGREIRGRAGDGGSGRTEETDVDPALVLRVRQLWGGRVRFVS